MPDLARDVNKVYIYVIYVHCHFLVLHWTFVLSYIAPVGVVHSNQDID